MRGGRGFGMMRRRPLGWGRWRRPMLWSPFAWHWGTWARWLWIEPFMLLLFGPTAYKLHESDVHRIEEAAGRPAADMSEAELLAAMRTLGIKKLVLTDEDEAAIADA